MMQFFFQVQEVDRSGRPMDQGIVSGTTESEMVRNLQSHLVSKFPELGPISWSVSFWGIPSILTGTPAVIDLAFTPGRTTARTVKTVRLVKPIEVLIRRKLIRGKCVLDCVAVDGTLLGGPDVQPAFKADPADWVTRRVGPVDLVKAQDFLDKKYPARAYKAVSSRTDT